MQDSTPVFSPSATETHSKCPRKWALNRAGWKPRIIQYPELCAVLGDGFSVSMNLLNSLIIEGVTTLPRPEILAIGQRAMSDKLATYLDAGRRIHTKDEAFADLLPLRLEQAVNLYIDNNPLKDWRIIQSEKTYEQHGRCRIDVLADPLDSLGPAVVDYKLKAKLDPEWLDVEIDKHAKTQQRFHYQWATGAKRFYIILVVLAGNRKKITPYIKISAPFGASPYYDSGLWLEDAESLWYRMGQDKQVLAFSPDIRNIDGSAVHEDKWGPCEFEDACMTHALDEAAMNVQYVKIERSK
jgi:hypothetical protein